MAYLDERCSALCHVLDHASDLKAHRLCGYVANLEPIRELEERMKLEVL
ncbi:MAG: hypothetical protein HY901_13795 [Deltaproteobacteria bacterium]|nr:hypothetical protein [Deltaproteobacteria bacterium]